MTSPLNPTEHEDAVTLARYLLVLQRMGKITLYSHVPNETYTPSFAVRRRNTQEGVRMGVPDYIIIVGNKVLFLELKRLKGSNTSDEQKEWILHLQGKTTEARICHGADQAMKFVSEFVANPPQI
jgi:hypothetical protein